MWKFISLQFTLTQFTTYNLSWHVTHFRVFNTLYISKACQSEMELKSIIHFGHITVHKYFGLNSTIAIISSLFLFHVKLHGMGIYDKNAANAE